MWAEKVTVWEGNVGSRGPPDSHTCGVLIILTYAY